MYLVVASMAKCNVCMSRCVTSTISQTHILVTTFVTIVVCITDFTYYRLSSELTIFSYYTTYNR